MILSMPSSSAVRTFLVSASASEGQPGERSSRLRHACCAASLTDRLASRSEIRTDRAGAVAEEAGDLMHVARFAALADERGFHALAGADEMMMHRAGREQHRHGTWRDRPRGRSGSRMRAPSATALRLRRRCGRWRSSRPASPSLSGQVQSIVRAGSLAFQAPQRGELVLEKDRRFELDEARVLGRLARRLRRQPSGMLSDMTSFSRIGSIGGLVTCAKSCLK